MSKAKTAKKGKAKTAATQPSVLYIGGEGKTLMTATDVAESLSINPKALRAFLRSGDGIGNDGKYTRYRVNPKSSKGKAFLKRCRTHFS